MQKRRANTRLPNWDYSSKGAYFLTFCTHGRRHILGEVAAGASCGEGAKVVLSGVGAACSQAIEDCFADDDGMTLHAYVVMPNHVHILCQICGGFDSGGSGAISAMIGRIKAATTRKAKGTLSGGPLWQRGFHDHIVRDEADFARVFEYIQNNPARWAEDRFNES